jgi:hypothetical protein
MELHVLGIRHHGCGSARSVKAALAEIKPDIVLIEGPPEAERLLPMAVHEEMRPPVAILIYSTESPQNAVFYPFAEFSPEWQAVRFALENKIPVRFFDLPQSFQISDSKTKIENPEAVELSVEIEEPREEDQSKIQNPKSKIKDDPLGFAARAAGFPDGEIWWESLVETRRDPTGIFEAVLELMTALRDEAEREYEAFENSGRKLSETEEAENLRELRREAFMRCEIRRAKKEGFKRAAVVCGAWHAPKLGEFGAEAADRGLLKNLPRTKLEATWIPYSFNRLAFSAGYGAGIRSPEFYQRLWENPQNINAFWLARVAHLLREQGLDASPASVIEAVRLAESLAVMRGLSAAGLTELFDSVRSVFCFGDDAQLRLIEEKLIVGERLGEVPSGTPTVPLRADLAAAQKRLRFPAEPVQKTVELDLRKAGDLEKSRLLHRLRILGVEWGRQERAYGKGTFKEKWGVRWEPEFEIRIIEASLYGSTVERAATGFVREKSEKSGELSELTTLASDVLLAELPSAIEALMRRLQEVASVTSDVPKMMDAFLPLADILRYGNVRRTETAAVAKIVDSLAARICINLPNACSALNDESAEAMFKRISAVNVSIGVLENAGYENEWQKVLRKLASQRDLHGLIKGKAVRILFEKNLLTVEELEKSVRTAVTTAVETDRAAAWIEGFLRGSGLVLIYNEKLLEVLNDWVLSLDEETFIQLLPILRRTFSSFEAPERRNIGERLKGERVLAKKTSGDFEIDERRAGKVLPLIEKILGL